MKKSTQQKKLKKPSILMTLLPLSACGGGGGAAPSDGGSSTPPAEPTPPAEFVEDPTNVWIARDDRDTSLDQSLSTDDLTVTGKNGNDVISTGAGADTIEGAGGADLIRSGAGADTVDAGSGNDAIVLIGTTAAGQYSSGDITNAGNGFNLSSLISAAEINGNDVSDVVAGDVIDGGSGTNTLFIYGEVDLTGVTLSNVTVLEIHSVVTLTPDQLALFTSVSGDGSSVINIDVPDGDTYVLDLTGMSVADIANININGNFTVIISDSTDLNGIASIESTSGTLTLEVIDEGNDTSVNLSDVADTFEALDTITLEDQVTLNVDNASDVTDLSLSEIDGSGNIETDGSGTVDTALDTLTIDPAVNTKPVGSDDASSSDENETKIIDVLLNDSDNDGDDLSITSASITSGQGSVNIIDGKLQYNPGTHYDNLDNGDEETVTISYTINDGEDTDQATVTLTINGSNDAPILTADTDNAGENEIITVDVLSNDSDKDDDLTITAASVVNTGQGSVTIVDNQIKFDPGTDFDDLADGVTEEVTINYSASDGTVTETSTLKITVTGTNDAPIAVNDAADIDENVPKTIDVLVNDTDEETNGLTITSVQVPDGQGAVSISDNKIQYDAGEDFDHLGSSDEAEVTVTYTISDGEKSDEANLVLTITGSNDAPEVDGVLEFEVLENGELIFSEDELLANVSDVDTQSELLSITNLSAASGSLVDNEDGTWAYTPEANTHGEVELSYDVSDGEDSTASTANITVNEITFTIPYGDFAGTTLHFNDPLLPFQSNLTGSDFGDGAVPHINLVPVWGEYTGKGISIGTPEDIYFEHPEISNQYIVSDNEDGTYEDGYHGTYVTGIISASTDNGNSIAGISYNSLLSGSVNWSSYYQYDVMTFSVNIRSDLFYSHSFENYVTGITTAASDGRDGLGTIWVNSAGNSGNNDFTTDVDLFGSQFEIMLVGQVTQNGYYNESNYGSSLHMVVPLSTYNYPQTVLSIGQLNNFVEYISEDNYNLLLEETNFTNTSWGNAGLEHENMSYVGGSSLAAPHVTATTALMLEASEENIFDSTGLGWRDVQEIMAISAVHTGSSLNALEPYSHITLPDEHYNWTINGANNFNGGGLHFSPDYGFGMLNVHAAVRLAETWQLQHTSDNLVTHSVAFGSGETIEYGSVVEYELDMRGYSDLDLDVMSLNLGINHDYWPELQITVISPSGTESIILDTGGLTATNISEYNVSMTGAMDWEVLSRAFWGENTQGTWTIRIEDVIDNGNSGSVGSITAHFKGDLNTNVDTYFFTDDWSKMNDANGGVPILDDNTGVNSINAAAVSDDVTLDMNAGSTSQIGGVEAFSLSATTIIDIGITGDGNDTIRGIDAGDSVYAMRGDDTIEITVADFALIDGYSGEDSLILDSSNINLDLSASTITNIETIDLTGSGDNNLTLTLLDLTNSTDEDNFLMVDGNAGDSVISTGQGWAQGADQEIDGVTYDVYTSGTGTLLIDADVTQTIS